ncbi:MAG: hypothetical protein AB4050_12225 [Synechococcus sp.]
MEASGTDSHLFMLSTFRDRHPLGSVVTDLLRVEEGIYVVKAQISVGGIVLGSGMAGSTTVEEAEDAAIQRALRISGISSTSSLLGGSAALGSSSLDSVSLDTTNGHSISSSFEMAAPRSGSTSPSSSSSAIDANGFSSVDDWDAPPSVPEPAPSKLRKAAKPTPSKAKSQPEPEPELEPEIEDLSELIAQTDVELTRIGWGPKEGRRFLKERFSKQSRQQLDEAELRDFLQELKLQPTKMLDAAEF